MSPLPPGDSLPNGGNLPNWPSHRSKVPDWVDNKDDIIRRLLNAIESQRQAIETNLELREELRQTRLERNAATAQVVALTNIVNSLQGRVHAISAQARQALNTANQAWMGTAVMALFTVLLPLAAPAYNGACLAAKGIKSLASSAKATLATYGFTGIMAAPPLALGAAT